MRNLTVLAAALAAGLTTFAAGAQELASLEIDVNAPDAGEKLAAAAMAIDSTISSPVSRGLTREEVFHAEKVASEAAETTRLGERDDEDIKPARPYEPLIERYASMNGVSPALVHAVIQVESNYKPYSKGRAGEIGLMQIKPATARLMGYAGTTTGLFDPETNIKYGLKYLAKAQRLGGGSTCGTILKYDAGHGAKRMNPVSSDYCRKVKKRLAGI